MIDTRDIVNHAKYTGKLKLSFPDALMYHRADFLFSALSIDLIFATIWKISVFEDESLFIVNMIMIAVFLVIFSVRRRALKFTIIETKLSKEQVLALMKEIIEYYGWEIKTIDSDLVVVDNLKILDRSFDPPLDVQRTVGQRITVILDNNKVYVNSILQMHRLSGWQGVGSWKSNLENVNIIKEEIFMEEIERES